LGSVVGSFGRGALFEQAWQNDEGIVLCEGPDALDHELPEHVFAQ